MNPHFRRLLSSAAVALTLIVSSAYAQKVELPQPSPAASLKQRVGVTDIQIEYSRPSVRDRKIFGGLEPFGQVWRTGANAATKITFSTPVTFGTTQVPAGTYALFTIPSEKEWTVILNSVSGQWGSYAYDAKNDVARATAKPSRLSDKIETLTIDVNDIRPDSASLVIAWENTRVSVPLKVDLSEVPTKIEAALSGGAKADPGLYVGAALFYLERNLDLDKAAKWMDQGIAGNPEAFYLHHYKARILAKKGDKDGARAAAQKSLEMAKENKNEALKSEYIRLNNQLLSSLGQ